MSRYYSCALNCAYEGVETVPVADARKLAEALRESGLEAYLAWERENRDEVVEFLRAEPAARLKKKAWKDPERRSRLALAALHLGRLASAVLDRSGGSYIGSSYREATESAALLALQILDENQKRVWPWACKPPGAEWIAPHWDEDSF